MSLDVYLQEDVARALKGLLFAQLAGAENAGRSAEYRQGAIDLATATLMVFGIPLGSIQYKALARVTSQCQGCD